MKTVEAVGYSKTKAFETTNLGVDLGMLKNASLAWKKAGSPINTRELNKFMENYIKDKKAVGAYIVIEAAADDTRLRPYNVINEVTNGKRKSTTTYQIKEADFVVKYTKATKIVVNKETGEEKVVDILTPYHKETITVTSKTKDEETGEVLEIEKEKEIDVTDVTIHNVGSVEGKANRKDTAFKLMKELIEENKKDYVVEIVKEVTDGQKYAGYGVYTPSKSAKEGKFMFFVSE